MRINKIHIISFGGLKNYTLNFSDGLNCLLGANEQGKTTIMSFIKMMFYGSERGSSQISKNIRKKYTPWDGSQMAGSIEFEKDGRSYKLEREFRSSNSTDRVSLTDLSLGEKQTVEGDIGVRLFGLSAAAFERSIFIGQLGFPDNDTAAESELNAKLSNIASTGDEQISLETVSARIEKTRFALISKSGRAGEYYKNSIITEETRKKLEHSIDVNSRYLEGKERLISHTKETVALVKRSDVLKAQLSRRQDIENAQKLKELLAAKDSLEAVKKELTLTDGTPADENYLRNLKFSSNRLQSIDNKVKIKENEVQIIKKQLDTLVNGPKLSYDETPEKLSADLLTLDNNLISLKEKATETAERLKELNVKKQSTKSTLNPTLLILGICLLLVSGVMYFVLPAAAIPFTAVSVIFTALSFILKSDKKTKISAEEILSLENILSGQNGNIEDLTAQINDKKTKLEAIRLAASSNIKVIEAQKSCLDTALSELEALKTEQAQIASEFNAVLNKLNIDRDNTESAFTQLENAVARQKELKQHIGFLLRDLNNISYEDAKAKLMEMDKGAKEESIDFDKINQEYENLQKEISARKEIESDATSELKAMLSGVESTDVLQGKLNELTDILNAQKEFCDSADIALEALKESFAELRQTYGSQLEKKSAEIFSSLTGGKYNGMTVSKSFSLNVENAQNPISREAEYLSSGTYDQAYLSLRLAVAFVLGENLPLFLDDSLAQYDDLRAVKTLEFLKKYSENSQTIMFTCHKSILDSAEKLGCNTAEM